MIKLNQTVSPATALATLAANLHSELNANNGCRDAQAQADFIDCESFYDNQGNATAEANKAAGAAKAAFDTVNTQEFRQTIMTAAGIKDSTDPRIDTAVQMATYTAMAKADPAAYMARYLNADPMVNTNTVEAVVDSTSFLGGVSFNIDVESFEKTSFDNFIATAMVANALAATTNSAEELLFKTVAIPPGAHGLEIAVRIPEFYQRTKRTGGAFNVPKTRLTEGLIDRSKIIVETNKVIPNAGVAANDVDLVAASDVANRTEKVGKVNVSYRPLKVDREIDLLRVSANTELHGDGVQDERDVLGGYVGLGKVYVKVTNDNGGTPISGVFEIDTTGYPGSTFYRSQDGNTSDTVLSMKQEFNILSNGNLYNETTAQALKLDEAAGQTAGTPTAITIKLSVNGTGSASEGNVEVGGKVAVLGGMVGTADIPTADMDTFRSNVTFELIGFLPEARRTNSNLRDRGIYIDNGRTFIYRIPVPIGAPITSQNPNSGNGDGAGIDGLQMAMRIRSSAYAMETLKHWENLLESGRVPKNSTAVGSLLVKPTFIREEIDVIDNVIVFDSKNGLESLRSHLAAQITVAFQRLLVESEYLAALDVTSGTSASGYEAVIVTDPVIGAHIMQTGDSRTLGALSDFRIAISHEKSIAGKIVVTVRRPNVDGADALSFGVHGVMAPLHYTANVQDGGAQATEVQILPREIHAVTCPVLAVIDVKNVDKLFTKPVTP